MCKLASLSVEINSEGYVVTDCEYADPEKLRVILDQANSPYTEEMYEAIKFMVGELLILQTQFANKYDTVEV